MKFTQPRLPYAPDALAPVISATTIDFHYGKHEKAYIDTLNTLIENTPFSEMSLEEIICKSDGKLFNNASQAWNHIFYFFQFSPNGLKEPSGKLREQIESQFESVDAFKKKFEEAGATLFGSGWVWLSADDKGTLFITQGGNASNPMTQGLKPILTFDVWEHAYYLDYQNRRAEYLHSLWDIVDWDIVGIRYGE
ncbi:superoxide dismutase [uncultured Duncaniella sp.]|uniref:superoxide dismutase n=1 Tax=uncultured Duncaniella sp. TaxID=2768039 RepID=UPI0026587B9E|nr:superoxide dismutase [uncultured Duncaniella sp.]